MTVPFLRTLLVAALAAAPAAVSAAARVALVIGNSAYEHTTPLANPRHDAEAVAEALAGLGFDVVTGFDLVYADLTPTLREFAIASQDAELSLFYYAGHGVAVEGENYLVPVDARLQDARLIDLEAFPISKITRQMRYTEGANLIFLDACRNNPLARSLSQQPEQTRMVAGGGLSEMSIDDNGFGTAIVFATEPGAVAYDGQGRHSPFTEALLANIGAENTPISSVLNRITGDVWEATDKRQRPWVNQSFTGDVYLNRVAVEPAAPVAAAPAPAPAAATATALEEERAVFEVARASGDPRDYRLFLELYPQGRFAPFARSALERLEADAAAAAAPGGRPAETARPAAESAPAAVAALAPEPATRAAEPTAPLTLATTPQVAALPADAETEAALALDRDKWREIQARLTALGAAVGGIDGRPGPRTRSGLAAWQSRNGLSPSGRLNAPQLEMLTAQSETAYGAVLAAAERARARQRAARRNAAPKPAENAPPEGGTATITPARPGLQDTILGRAVMDIVSDVKEAIGE